MKTWKTLSGPFEAPNGHTVQPVGSEGELEELGVHLRNGLIIPEARSQWADQCIDGNRQIFGVRDESGDLVANGEFKVRNGNLSIMFVRADRNRELRMNDPAFDAVSAYVTAVNARALPLTLNPVGNGFVSVEPSHAPEGPWERAVRISGDQAMSPFAALVLGLGKETTEAELDAAVVPFEDATWPPLTAPYNAAGGLTVEPVSSRSGLRTLGAELENNLFNAQMTSYVALACQEGQMQILAIYRADEGIIAFGQISSVGGQVVSTACRGYADEDVPADVTAALASYVDAINTHAIESRLSAGNEGFVEGPTEPSDSLFNKTPLSLPAAIPMAIRDGYDPEFSLDDIQGHDGPFVDDYSVSWDALTDDYTASNGYVIEPVIRQSVLREMGAEMDNALSVGYRMWAQKCINGESQIVRILSSEGRFVANSELQVQDGEVRPLFNLGHRNVGASPEAVEALNQYCEVVNSNEINLHGEIDNDGFRFERPEAKMGM